MRIIEPHKHHKHAASDRHSRRRKIIGLSVLVAVLCLLVFALTASKAGHENILGIIEGGNSKSHTEPAPTPHPVTYKYFSPEDFQKLYDKVTYPNTQPISEPPTITGNKTADERIREIAESRGYELHVVPVQPITNTDEPGLTEDNLLQHLAYNSWQTLKKQADKDGIKLNLSSGYRSIDLQRRFFLAQLSARQVSAAQIASGSADNQVVSVLHTVSPPGYSRHHTGYTMDFTCGDGQTSFRYTPCFAWLKKDNYINAKKAGLIPSYPDGADSQGPEPEPWEYVWVGSSFLQN